MENGGRFEIPRHRDRRNFVIVKTLRLPAVSQSRGIIDWLIWSQIQDLAPHFGEKFQLSHHGMANLALFCFHKTYFSPLKCKNYLFLT